MLVDFKKLAFLCKDLKLLYVEDDDLARKATFKLLQNFFKEIIVAVDGEDGLEKFRKHTPDLILTDINMPKVSGLEMMQCIRNEQADVPILLLSAYSDSEYFLEAIALNIDGYLIKPLDNQQLFRVLFKSVEKIDLMNSAKNYQVKLEREVKRRNEEISRQLHFDALTELLSRYSFFKDLKVLKSPFILLVNIDKFKVINEVYGSEIGSKVLENFALYLNLTVDSDCCRVYRIVSDEFAIISMDESLTAENYEGFVTSIFKDFNNIRLQIDNHVIALSITVGLSSVCENAYESAKIALDYAKEHRKPYVMYSSRIDDRKESSLTLEVRDKIASAIDDDRIVAVYHPIVDRNANIVKYETLMRLEDKHTAELITPFYFLDVAFKTRQYEHLSSKVIKTSLENLQNTDKMLSINFAYSDIEHVGSIQKLEAFFKKNNQLGKQVVFEITESQAIENYDYVKEFIRKFRQYGVSIAIDDFGSGFSNFEYILEIEPDYLKIDGSLVKDIDTDIKSFTLVEAIVQFSHKLGIRVIAEYVHSKIIFEMLKSLDVDEYQGFYFSEPLQQVER